MSILRVGILRGGPEPFYEASLLEGGKILEHMYDHLGNSVQLFDIWIDKGGVWHLRGIPVLPTDLLSKVDLVWNTTHGDPASILQSLQVSKVSPTLFTNSLLRNRSLLEEHLSLRQIAMPRSIIIPAYQVDFDGEFDNFISKRAKEIWQKFSPPWILSAVSNNPNYAKRVVKTFPELFEVLAQFLSAGEGVLVEELILGKDATIHSIAGFRGNKWYHLPAGHVQNRMFSLAHFDQHEKTVLKSEAQKILEHLGHDGYAKLELVITPRNKVYLKNISFHPDFGDHSHLHAALDAFGVERREVLEHMLKKALVL